MVSILIDDEFLLRSFQPDDAPSLFKAVDESRQHLRNWLRWVDVTTKQEHILQFILRTQQQQYNQEALELGIFHNREDDAAGLEAALRRSFDQVKVDVIGTVAVFSARNPLRNGGAGGLD